MADGGSRWEDSGQHVITRAAEKSTVGVLTWTGVEGQGRLSHYNVAGWRKGGYDVTTWRAKAERRAIGVMTWIEVVEVRIDDIITRLTGSGGRNVITWSRGTIGDVTTWLTGNRREKL